MNINVFLAMGKNMAAKSKGSADSRHKTVWND